MIWQLPNSKSYLSIKDWILNTFLKFSPIKTRLLVQKKQTLQQTLQLIANILSFDTSDTLLETKLMDQKTDWDSVVVVASKHLMLPALYCRLKHKKMLKHLPEDLVVYLKELTELNRSRNIQLLKEAQEISQLFERHHLNHSFIKGIALLSGNYYEDVGERMVGDIDILVDSRALDTAFELLVDHGYSRFIDFNYKVKNYRHLPRQISENHLGAVELHDQLLKHGYNDLIDKAQLLDGAQMFQNIKIPNATDLIRNSIFAHQINDNGYFMVMLKLKSAYDVLSLKTYQNEDLLRELYNEKYSSQFLGMCCVFFPELENPEKELKKSHSQSLFVMMLRFPEFARSLIKIKFVYLNIRERFQLLLSNESYRQHIFKNKMLK